MRIIYLYFIDKELFMDKNTLRKDMGIQVLPVKDKYIIYNDMTKPTIESFDNTTTPPSTTPPYPDTKYDYNNDYIIQTLLTDPELSVFFTYENHECSDPPSQGKWNRTTLAKTIKRILGNSYSEYYPSLSETTIISNTKVPTRGPTPYPLPFQENNSVNKNVMTFTDKNNTTFSLINAFPETEGEDGNLELGFNTINNKDTLKLTYNIPKNLNNSTNPNNNGSQNDMNTEYYTLNSGKKCHFTTVCTKKHFYYPNCKTDICGNDCSCKCSSIMEFNTSGLPHTHCDDENTDESLKALNNNSSLISSLAGISSIQFRPTTVDLKEISGGSGSPSIFDPNLDNFILLIVDYYVEIIKNKHYYSQLKNTNMNSDNKSQMHVDSNEIYQGEYIKIVNMSVGIFTSMYILYSIFTD